MSQPPYPTPPQPYAYPPAHYYGIDPAAQLLAPARRAGILLFLVGAGALVFGGCFGVMAVALLSPEFASNPDMQKALADTGVDMPTMRIVLFVMAGLIAGFAVVAGVLGFFVRRGTVGPLVTALIVSGLATALMLLWLIGGLASGQIAALCVLALPAAVLIFLDITLIQALTRSGDVARSRAQTAYGSTYPHPYPGPYAAPPPPSSNPYYPQQ